MGMKIKITKYIPRKTEETIIMTEISIHTRITLEEIYLVSDAIYVMRKDTSPENCPKNKDGSQKKTS